METTELNVERGSFVAALEQVLPRYGYRSRRSFDLRLDGGVAPQLHEADQPYRCGCGFTVLLVYADAAQSGLEGTISVRGVDERSIVSLVAPDVDGELEARFPSILVDAVGMKSAGGEPACDYAQA